MDSRIKSMARKVQRQSSDRRDEVEPATAMRHEQSGFTFNKQAIRTTRIAAAQLCSLAGLPVRVYDKLSPEQRPATFNELFSNLGDRHLMFRFKGDQLLGVVSPNYQKIDNDVLMVVVRRAFSVLKLVPVTTILSPEYSFIRLIPEGQSASSRELTPCMTVANSEIGLSAFRIMAGVFRMVCGNGLIVEEKQRDWRWVHYGSDVEVKPNLSEVMYVANRHVRLMDGTKGRYLNVEQKIALANSIKRDLGVKVGNAFTEAANRDYYGGRDWYCAINALTHAAQLFQPLKQTEIEEYSGRILAGSIFNGFETN
ncbi:MAG TPA: DUF932 domain-containing protein [bacterium]|nr:DUF932 domain-containing protein [bacterium]